MPGNGSPDGTQGSRAGIPPLTVPSRTFALIAALRPSIIKIDREIVIGVKMDDAKQALVEAFVSFGQRIGARLVAEGIETRSDLGTLVELGVELGQGPLIGKPEAEPVVPRRGQVLRLAAPRDSGARADAADMMAVVGD